MKRRILDDTEVSFFCSQMADMLQSGITVTEALSILSAEEDIIGKAAGKLLEVCPENFDMQEAVVQSGIFPGYVAGLAGIGEETGRLDEAMQRLGVYCRKRSDFKSAVKEAIIKPTLTVCIALLVISLVAMGIFPVFFRVAMQAGIPDNSMELFMLNCCHVVCCVTAAVSVAAAFFGISVLAIYHTDSGKRLLNNVAAKMKWVQKISICISMSDLFTVISMMSSSGMTYIQSLEAAKETVSCRQVSNYAGDCIRSMEGGKDIREALSESGFLNRKYAKMAEVGFLSGNFEKSVSDISEKYMEEASGMLYKTACIAGDISAMLIPLVTGLIVLSATIPVAGLFSGM